LRCVRWSVGQRTQRFFSLELRKAEDPFFEQLTFHSG
jgi:hypothetical protein